MKCQYCQGACVKKGCYKRKQLYKCKLCLKYQRQTYRKQKISEDQISLLKNLAHEGVGIRAMARILRISKDTVQRKLISIAKSIVRPVCAETNQQYEVDELHTYIGNKNNECWIIYAINKSTRQVIDFVVGKRTKANVSKVIDSVKMLAPKRIFTDRLNIYPSLIDKSLHITRVRYINHIERKNLDLRKDIKCLSRKTICYSKSEEMLIAKLTIYFFSRNLKKAL